MLVSPSVTPMQSKDPEEGPRCTQKDSEYIIYYISKVLIEIHKSWTDMLKSIMIPILLSCIVATDEIRRVKHVSLFKCAQKA